MPRIDVEEDISLPQGILPIRYKLNEANEIIKKLDDRNIEFDTQYITDFKVPNIYGVYYHYMYGVIYDTNTNTFRYPELDPFNIYVNK